MSKRTLGKARGLNSIADPSEFKGASGRRPAPEAEAPPPPPTPDPEPEIDSQPETPTVDYQAEESPVPATSEVASVTPAASQTETPSKRASSRGAIGARKRRELSVPIPVAEAVDATGVNPADLVMAAYKNHSDALYAGTGGRKVSRGRQRLRVSISDSDFDKITRLGETRGWNRSETVAVLLTMELMAEATPE